MLIVMNTDASQTEISAVIERADAMGLTTHIVRGEERTAIGLTGNLQPVMRDHFIQLQGVQDVVPISKPYKLASREFHPQDTVFDLGGVAVGAEEILIIAGPCSVESRSQLLETAHAVREAGAHRLGVRAGARGPHRDPQIWCGPVVS